jgi:hypothetical protein
MMKPLLTATMAFLRRTACSNRRACSCRPVQLETLEDRRLLTLTYDVSSTEGLPTTDGVVSSGASDNASGNQPPSISHIDQITGGDPNEQPQKGNDDFTYEDTFLVFWGGNAITVKDVDTANLDVVLTVPAGKGALTLNSPGGGLIVAGDGTNTVIISGPWDGAGGINAALNGSYYAPPVDFYTTADTPVPLEITATDGIATSNLIVELNVHPVNDPPTIAKPGDPTINEDTPYSLAGIVIRDDSPNGHSSTSLSKVQFSLSANHGRFNITPNPAGSVVVDSNGTSSVTITGTVKDINTTLDRSRYQPLLDFNGSDVLTIHVDDLGNIGGGSGLTDTETLEMNVNAVNDPPALVFNPDPVNVAENAGDVEIPNFVALRLPAGHLPTPADEDGQTVSIRGTSELSDPFNVVSTVNVGSDGQLTFTVNPGKVGLAEIAVSSQDDGPGMPTAFQTFRIIVGQNLPPIFDQPVDITVVEDEIVEVIPDHLTGLLAGPPNDYPFRQQIQQITVDNDNPDLFSIQPDYVDIRQPVDNFPPADDVPGSADLSFQMLPNAFGVANVSVTVTDTGGTSNGGVNTTVKTFKITVNAINNAPQITSLTSSHEIPCQNGTMDAPVSIDGTFFDVDTSDTHTVTVDWGEVGGETETFDATEVEPSQYGSFQRSHTYPAGGIYTITVTIDDGNGGTATETTAAAIAGVGLVDDTLYVIGTDGKDIVTVKRVGAGGGDGDEDDDEEDDEDHDDGGPSAWMIKVVANFNVGNSDDDEDDEDDDGPGAEVHRFDPAGIEYIHIVLCGGNDVANVGSGNDDDDDDDDGSGSVLTIPAFISGGAGNDKLTAGGGDDLVVGGLGRDLLKGRGGDDILIGGDGKDNLRGGTGEDLLVSGLVDLDDEELVDLHALWSGGGSYADRVASVTSVLLRPNITVHKDADRDKLKGGRGRDVFFAQLAGRGKDRVIDDKANEEVFELF